MASTTTSLSGEVATYYDKVFLERVTKDTVYSVGASERRIPANMGKTISWSKRAPLSPQTTALTEATTPSDLTVSSTQVTATLAPYGGWVKVSQLFELTSIDQDLEEHVSMIAQNAVETLDELVKVAMAGNGTEQLANNVSAVTSITANDTIDGAEVRKAVATIKKNGGKPFDGDKILNGHFGGVVPVSVAHDLRADSEWTDAYKYTDAMNLRNGRLGTLHGVEFFETNNEQVAVDAGSGGTVDVYSTFIFGAGAYGTVSLEGQPGHRIYVKHPGAQDTSNPLDVFSTVGWKAYFAAKVLDANWLVEVKTASSIGNN